MDREQIIKALEWCSELRLCVDCPMRAEGYFSHSGNACRKALMENSLALIKELTEENERLRADNDELCDNIACLEIDKENAERRTARKMQERLKRECFDNEIEHMSIYTESQVLFVIDQIAKEMLEGNNENND